MKSSRTNRNETINTTLHEQISVVQMIASGLPWSIAVMIGTLLLFALCQCLRAVRTLLN